MAVDRELQLLLDFLAESDAPPMESGTAEDARRAFRSLAVDLRDDSKLTPVDSVEPIRVPGGDGELDARVYRPAADGTRPTVVLLHGGGFTIGDLDTHEQLARDLAVLCDTVVVSVAYRLAPEHPFPAAVDDAAAAAHWAAEHLADLGGTDALAVAGDSAGGNLAAVLAQSFRDEGRPLAGQLLIYPATDFLSDLPSRTEYGQGYFLDDSTSRWFGEQYVGHLDLDDLHDPRISPLHGRLDGLAPAVVAVGECDPLRDEGIAYADAMRAAGVPTTLRVFDGMIHGFMDMAAYSPGARAAVVETCRLFRGVLHP